MILKTLGKLFLIWLTMMGVLAMAAIAVVILALIVKFRLVFAIALVFIGIGYFVTWASGIQVTTKPKFAHVYDDKHDQHPSGIQAS